MPQPIAQMMPARIPPTIPPALEGGEDLAGGGPAGMPEPLQPTDPLQAPPAGGLSPPAPGGPPPPGMPVQAGQPGMLGNPAAALQPGPPAAAPGQPPAPQQPAPPPAPPLGAPGTIACAVADPNSQEGAQCAAAQAKAAGWVPDRAAMDKAAAAVDAFVASARRPRPDASSSTYMKKAAPSDFIGTPMGAGLQALRAVGPPPVPPVMQPRRPGLQPATNLAPGGMGTALSHRPLAGGMSAMQGKPMLPGVQGPNGLFGRPGPSIGGLAGVGIPRATAATKVARLIANHEKRAFNPFSDHARPAMPEANPDKFVAPDPQPELSRLWSVGERGSRALLDARREREHRTFHDAMPRLDPPEDPTGLRRLFRREEIEADVARRGGPRPIAADPAPPPASYQGPAPGPLPPNMDRSWPSSYGAGVTPNPAGLGDRPGHTASAQPGSAGFGYLPAAAGGLGGAALGGLLDRRHRLRGALIGGGLGLGAGLLGQYAGGMKAAGFSANHEKRADEVSIPGYDPPIMPRGGDENDPTTADWLTPGGLTHLVGRRMWGPGEIPEHLNFSEGNMPIVRVNGRSYTYASPEYEAAINDQFGAGHPDPATGRMPLPTRPLRITRPMGGDRGERVLYNWAPPGGPPPPTTQAPAPSAPTSTAPTPSPPAPTPSPAPQPGPSAGEGQAANPFMSMIGRAGRINARVGGAGRELRGIGSVAMPAGQAYRAYNTATTSPWVPGGAALAGAGLGALVAGRRRRLLGGLIGGGLGLGAGILGQQALQHAPGMLMRYAGGTKAAGFEERAEALTYTDPVSRKEVTRDHVELGRELAEKLRKSAEGHRQATLLHDAMVDHMTRITEKRAMDDYYACGGDPECIERARKGREERARARAKQAADKAEKGPDGQPKASQEQAHYGPSFSAARSCAMCANFDGQGKCAVVAGPIQPTGTSDMFTPRPEMAALGPASSLMPAMSPEGTKLGHYPGCGRRKKLKPWMPAKGRFRRKKADYGPVLMPFLPGMLGGALIGGGVGAYRAPKGHKLEGAARGSLFGRSAGTLGAGGALLGGVLAQQLAGERPGFTPTALAGAAAGGLAGGVGGHQLTRWVLGPASWENKGKDKDKDKDRSEKTGAAQEKCGCSGNTLCGPCAAKARKKYKEVRPERREGAARFAWRGRGAKDVTDDPGYEKYTRKAASAALDALLARARA